MKKRKRITKVAYASTTELEEFEAFLGPLADDYTDGELRQLRREMNAMAEILLDVYMMKNKQPKSPSIDF